MYFYSIHPVSTPPRLVHELKCVLDIILLEDNWSIGEYCFYWRIIGLLENNLCRKHFNPPWNIVWSNGGNIFLYVVASFFLSCQRINIREIKILYENRMYVTLYDLVYTCGCIFHILPLRSLNSTENLSGVHN